MYYCWLFVAACVDVSTVRSPRCCCEVAVHTTRNLTRPYATPQLISPVPEARTQSLLRVRKARATSPDVSSAAAVAVASTQVCIFSSQKDSRCGKEALTMTMNRRSERSRRRMDAACPCSYHQHVKSVYVE